MKKLFLAIAALACIFTSCRKAEIIDDNGSEVNVEPLVFHASIVNATKTSIAIDGSAGKISWVADDRITVTCASGTDIGLTAVYEADQSGSDTDFTYVSGTVFSDENAKYSATYGDIDNQVYSATGANCPMTAPIVTGTSFTFSESAPLLKLNVKADGVSVKEVYSQGKTLTCSPAVTLNTSTGTDFYIAIPAGTYSDPKLSFSFVSTDDKICTKTLKSALTLAANDIQPITLGTALNFVATPPAEVYYDNAGNTYNTPQAFNAIYNTYNHSEDNFILSFSTSAGNAIDFSRGDVIEAEIASCIEYPFVIGDLNPTAVGQTITGYANGANNWWRVQDQYDNSAISDYADSFAAPLIVRISSGGIEYKVSGAFKTYVKSSQTTMAHVLTLGTGSPLYFGLLGLRSASASYNYLKVTRCGGVPSSGNDPVASVSVTTSEKTVTAGEHFTLTANVLPVSAVQTVTWTSSNSSIATVNPSTGEVTGIAEGSCIITATSTDNPGKFGFCTLTVSSTVPVESISVADANVLVGGSKTLTATVLPDDASDKSVTWSSSNTSVATVNVSTGEVTGVTAGDCTITATSVSDPSVSGSCTLTVLASLPEVILRENYTTTSSLDPTELEIIASGVPSNSQICFNNGDYLEMKLHRLEMQSGDHDIIYVGSKASGTQPFMVIIGHANGTGHIYMIPGYWWIVGPLSTFGVDDPLYVRLGCKADGTRGCGSFSLDGTNWTAFDNGNDFEAQWQIMTSPSNTPLIIQSARGVGNLQLSEYEYIKIVRNGATATP